MSEKKVKFEFEKQNKNSVRYKEVPDDDMLPVICSIYVQKCFAGESKNIELVITKKLNGHYGKAGSTIDIVF
jgi:hypothetical protein